MIAPQRFYFRRSGLEPDYLTFLQVPNNADVLHSKTMLLITLRRKMRKQLVQAQSPVMFSSQVSVINLC
jgi:hypothetical protein